MIKNGESAFANGESAVRGTRSAERTDAEREPPRPSDARRADAVVGHADLAYEEPRHERDGERADALGREDERDRAAARRRLRGLGGDRRRERVDAADAYAEMRRDSAGNSEMPRRAWTYLATISP